MSFKNKLIAGLLTVIIACGLIGFGASADNASTTKLPNAAPSTLSEPAQQVAVEPEITTPSVQPESTPPAPVALPYEEPIQANGACDNNYSPCIQISTSDLDCADIGIEVRIIGLDVHRLDRDDDGYGCETYR